MESQTKATERVRSVVLKSWVGAGARVNVWFKLLLLFLLPTVQFAQHQITFDTIQTVTTGSRASVISVADLNNDGLNDMAVGLSFDSDPANDFTIKIYYQDTAGNLLPPISILYPIDYPGLNSLAVGDFNGDARNDLVVGSRDHIYVAYQLPNGGFSTFYTIFNQLGSFRAIVADINNDGLDDIISTRSADGVIRFFYQNSGSTLFTVSTIPKTVSNCWGQIEIGDVNNDGLPDLVHLPELLNEGVAVHTQNANGSFNGGITYFSPTTWFDILNDIAIGDFNGDGLIDIAASKGGNIPSAWLVIWLQDSVTNLFPANPIQLSVFDVPTAITSADLDCSGKTEIVLQHHGWARTSVTSFDSAGVPTTKYLYNVYGEHNRQSLAVGDINSDGRNEIMQCWNSVVSIKYNVTEAAPNQYNYVSTTIVIDTLGYTTTQTTNTFFVVTQADSSNTNYIQWQIDSFLVTQTIRFDSLFVDSLFIYEAFVCAKRFVDTISKSHSILAVHILQTDTVDWSSSIFTENVIVELKVYPNPSEGEIFIELPSPLDQPGTMFTISNERGQVIMKDVWLDLRNKRRLNLHYLSAGMYVLRLQFEEVVASVKIILIH